MSLGDSGVWLDRRGTATLRACARPGQGLGVRTKGPRPLPCRPRPPPRPVPCGQRQLRRRSCLGQDWRLQTEACSRTHPVLGPSAGARWHARPPPVPCASGLCIHPDSLKQNYLLSHRDPLSLSWRPDGLRRRRQPLAPGLHWLRRPWGRVRAHVFVGFRDEVDRVAPKTAQMAETLGHLTAFSA